MFSDSIKRVLVLDLGINNLLSLVSSLSELPSVGHVEVQRGQVVVDNRFKKNDTILCLPGMGHFGKAIEVLSEFELDLQIREWVSSGGALLGICLGMQLMLEGSEESPESEGLGLISGFCEKLSATTARVPNMGWSPLLFEDRSKSLYETPVAQVGDVYFNHSFVANLDEEFIVARSFHGEAAFPAIIQSGRVVGMQFHPEKSSAVGLNLLDISIGTI